MTQITQVSDHEQEIIVQLRTLSPEHQRAVIDLIGALQVPATPQESKPELEDDNNADIKIGLYQVLGKSELTFEHEGQVIYPLIAEAFNQGKKVVVSFDNVQLITWSFVTKAIGQLYEHFSESQIQSCLELVDITEEDLEFVYHVMETKKEFLINPEKFRQPMSDEQLEELRRKNPDNPILQVVGMFKDDPTFDDMLADIAEYRRELDEEYFRQIDAEEVGN
ncbi:MULTISPECIES: STAS-like domain-containing protein [Planktothrix]|jgi:hypothetical protein|uniref:DUF4325 domain-containing protein n=2 Tax=Planktothrix agardhii TaxID=1160 RepID=A0A1J1JLH2_PLAAG|nr:MULTISPECIES: STAS-like domain-containing protein [Planktothrix]MCF3609752.1 STAS-like domain-containing protein [Planktothrix agardhii 1033]CAD5912367.1 hypothetical protein NO108_00495 [Planktothrix rubescens]MCB8751243.1 STAS-like domain-containing protein [Planktothrix agardhii 1810]MCF3623902.1 STAS-like domain-containing protein [Planktothrix agardhii 1801]CAD5910223.1 hypothetical protein NO2A_00333 [Planktothrix agardhii]